MEKKRFGPVWFIPGDNRGKYPFCHSVYVEAAGIVIDPASDRKALKELREGPGVREVWLTHWHEDHLMHLDLFDDLPLRIAEKEAPPLADLEVFLDWYGLDDPEARKWWKQVLISQFHFKPRRPAGGFRGGEVLDLGEVTVEVIPCPGHTPGHMAFFFREPGVLFMGDYDLGKFGPWYGDRDSNIEDTIASVEKLRQVPARVWLTAHERGVFEENPGPEWDRYLGIIREREERLLDFLREPRSLEEIVRQWIIYRKPREPESFFYWAEKALITKHLERLMKSGALAQEKGLYRRR